MSLAAVAPASAATYQDVYDFTGGQDGDQPFGELVADKSGMLYGTTLGGGLHGGGTVFRFDPTSGKLTTLYSFTTFGPTGSTPASGVILGFGGILFGTTESGGTGTCDLGCGTVFSLDPRTGVLKTLVDFQNVAQGLRPHGLILHGGVLYGATAQGGFVSGPANPGGGTLFSFNLHTKVFQKLHNFSEPGVDDGALPMTTLVKGPDGRLYGVASEDGANGNTGTVFALNTMTLAFSVIHTFTRHVDGAHPYGRLLSRFGKLLGTTTVGGPTAADYGVVYSIDSSGVLTNLHSFAGGTDAVSVMVGVTAGPGKRVYGVSSQGGPSGGGTIFSLRPGVPSSYTVLHDFSGTSYFPSGELLLYGGTTFYGVSSGGHGSIFKLVP